MGGGKLGAEGLQPVRASRAERQVVTPRRIGPGEGRADAG